MQRVPSKRIYSLGVFLTMAAQIASLRLALQKRSTWHLGGLTERGRYPHHMGRIWAAPKIAGSVSGPYFCHPKNDMSCGDPGCLSTQSSLKTSSFKGSTWSRWRPSLLSASIPALGLFHTNTHTHTHICSFRFRLVACVVQHALLQRLSGYCRKKTKTKRKP